MDAEKIVLDFCAAFAVRDPAALAGWFSEDAVYHPNYLKIAKDAGEGTYFTFGQPADEKIPEVAAFLKSYKDKYGDPGSYSAYAFDAANLLLTAVAKVGAGDPDKLAAEITCRPPVLLVHGEADPVVPFQMLAAAQAGLEAAGVAVQVLERPGLGHGIDEEGIRHGAALLHRTLLA